ncbi:uncharacterized protein LOC143187706 [Calliopsis andreniformis]|uniref:uncharacterized protein LOC143187706 n=1 Tax=Calliopsis andreniformis TaxID=337506 RepID=UPI003FCC6A52
MNSNTIVVLITLLGCAIAFPVRPESNSAPLVGIPIVVQEPTSFDGGPQKESSPLMYALLLSTLSSPEETSGVSQIQKRNAQDDEQDDLETAAGTYALRPLFVYRQQLAYRQRVREAIRRGNRF